MYLSRRDSPATLPPIPSTSINFQQVPTSVLRNAKLCPVASKGSYSRFRYFNRIWLVETTSPLRNNPSTTLQSNAATQMAEIELVVNVLAAVKLVKVMTSWPTTYLLLKNTVASVKVRTSPVTRGSPYVIFTRSQGGWYAIFEPSPGGPYVIFGRSPLWRISE
jgi:hypothetical protein